MTNAVIVTMMRLEVRRMRVAHCAAEQEAGARDRERPEAVDHARCCMSSAMPMPDWMPANTIVCTSTAGTTKSL